MLPLGGMRMIILCIQLYDNVQTMRMINIFISIMNMLRVRTPTPRQKIGLMLCVCTKLPRESGH